MRCKDYNEFSVLCISCNYPYDINCSKNIDVTPNTNKDNTVKKECLRKDLGENKNETNNR